MIKHIKRAIKLRRVHKEIQLLDTAAECLNKIRTSVPDQSLPGESSGSGGIEIQGQLKETALMIDELLKKQLEDFPL